MVEFPEAPIALGISVPKILIEMGVRFVSLSSRQTTEIGLTFTDDSHTGL